MEAAEVMRRLLYAGGIAIAAVSGKVDPRAVEELERLLGPGSVPSERDASAVAALLPQRIEDVTKEVPALRRIQVLRDLCLIASADRDVTDDERRVLLEIADALGVDRSMVTCSVPR